MEIWKSTSNAVEKGLTSVRVSRQNTTFNRARIALLGIVDDKAAVKTEVYI